MAQVGTALGFNLSWVAPISHCAVCIVRLPPVCTCARILCNPASPLLGVVVALVVGEGGVVADGWAVNKHHCALCPMDGLAQGNVSEGCSWSHSVPQGGNQLVQKEAGQRCKPQEDNDGLCMLMTSRPLGKDALPHSFSSSLFIFES